MEELVEKAKKEDEAFDKTKTLKKEAEKIMKKINPKSYIITLEIDGKEIKHVLTEKRGYAYQDIYYLKKDIDISDITLQKEEVKQVKYEKMSVIKEMMDDYEE